MKISILILAIVFSLNFVNFIRGEECKFPFTYDNKEHEECISSGHNRPWCYTDDQGNWKECDVDCKFPFTYKDKEYNSCTKVESEKPWCSLDYEYAGQWKECDQSEIDDNEDEDSQGGDNGNDSDTPGGDNQENNNGEQSEPQHKDCHFPFEYNGKEYQQCTNAGWMSFWCSMDKKYNGVWKECDKEPECYFPFTYKNRIYRQCTMVDSAVPWCSTEPAYIKGGYKNCEETACKHHPGAILDSDQTPNQGLNQCQKTEQSDTEWYCKEYTQTSGSFTWKKCETYHFAETDADCKFPFTYKGKEYMNCTYAGASKPWCRKDQYNWKYCTGGEPYEN